MSTCTETVTGCYTIKPKLYTVCHISVYFYGDFKPAVFQGHDLEDVAHLALCACEGDGESCERINSAFKSLLSSLDAGISIDSIASSHGARTARIALCAYDPWIEKLTDRLPLNPRIDYSHSL